MDRTELCNSLVTWMGTFSIPGYRDRAEDFTDGVLMMHALHQIAPSFFDEIWMSKIKKDAGSNWRLRVSNLKKILKGIMDFYSEVLGQQIHDFHMPDVQVIGEHGDITELGRLLQLILGCAVNCDDKQEYIQRIMGMEEFVQHSVMRAIQELMTKEVSSGGSDADSELQQQLKKTQEELNKVVGEKDELAQRCHVLDQQVTALQDEKANLEGENDRMNERLNQADNLEDPSTPAGRRYQLLQNQVEQCQLELERSEVTRVEYKSKMEAQERELNDCRVKNEELNELAEEARAVKDEIEILRYTSDKVTKYEAAIESYKKKLEELSDLKGQIKILDEKNTIYMEKNMELEEELKKSGTFKSQVEMYKSQFKELQNKCTEESDKAAKAKLEFEKLQKTLQTVQREKERLSEERDSLKEAIDNLEGSRAQEVSEHLVSSPTNSTSQSPCSEGIMGGGAGTDDIDGSGMFDLMSLPQDIKEKLIRLQHENKMLKLKQAENEGENSQLLQTMLEDANERKSELESQVRTLRERILELDAQVEDLNATHQSAAASPEDSSATPSTSASELRRKLQEAAERAEVAEAELARQQTEREELEGGSKAEKKKRAELEEELRRKDDEMRVMEEKYKRYLEKARNVISTLDPKYQQQSGGVDVQALRNQLQEKDRRIELLERDHDKTKQIREKEERLMVTSWYNLGMKLQRQAAEDRLGSTGAGQTASSFLGRQRVAHSRRSTVNASTPHHVNTPAR